MLNDFSGIRVETKIYVYYSTDRFECHGKLGYDWCNYKFLFYFGQTNMAANACSFGYLYTNVFKVCLSYWYFTPFSTLFQFNHVFMIPE